MPDVDSDATRTEAEIDAFKKRLEAWRKGLHAYSGYRLDLRGANLQGADLSPKRPDASDAVFSGALMQGARLEGASLSEARMEGANLRGAWMEGANLSRARLEGANLIVARMEGATLREARMDGADLSRARMEGADLNWVRMEGADLSWVRMEGADLIAARMEGADLWAARMEGAVLIEARLDGLTSLTTAIFQGAAVREVDFRKVRISAEQLNASFGDGSVRLAYRTERPDHWPEWKLDWRTFDTEYQKWRASPDTYTPPPKPEG